jgi:hypothetical protein
MEPSSNYQALFDLVDRYKASLKPDPNAPEMPGDISGADLRRIGSAIQQVGTTVRQTNSDVSGYVNQGITDLATRGRDALRERYGPAYGPQQEYIALEPPMMALSGPAGLAWGGFKELGKGAARTAYDYVKGKVRDELAPWPGIFKQQAKDAWGEFARRPDKAEYYKQAAIRVESKLEEARKLLPRFDELQKNKLEILKSRPMNHKDPNYMRDVNQYTRNVLRNREETKSILKVMREASRDYRDQFPSEKQAASSLAKHLFMKNTSSTVGAPVFDLFGSHGRSQED